MRLRQRKAGIAQDQNRSKQADETLLIASLESF
jgi:hypothetical protein